MRGAHDDRIRRRARLQPPCGAVPLFPVCSNLYGWTAQRAPRLPHVPYHRRPSQCSCAGGHAAAALPPPRSYCSCATSDSCGHAAGVLRTHSPADSRALCVMPVRSPTYRTGHWWWWGASPCTCKGSMDMLGPLRPQHTLLQIITVYKLFTVSPPPLDGIKLRAAVPDSSLTGSRRHPCCGQQPPVRGRTPLTAGSAVQCASDSKCDTQRSVEQ